MDCPRNDPSTLTASLPNPATLEQARRLFDALSNRTHLHVVVHLLDGPCEPGALARETDATLAVVRRSLQTLAAAGVVRRTKDNEYALATERVRRLVVHVLEYGTTRSLTSDPSIRRSEE